MVIHWFRNDLRLTDNPALLAATRQPPVLALYLQQQDRGAAGRWWRHHSLEQLSRQLGDRLHLYDQPELPCLLTLCRRHTVTTIFANARNEPWHRESDRQLQRQLKSHGITLQLFNGSRLWEHDQVVKQDGGAYRVFTPFFRQALSQLPPPRPPLPIATCDQILPRAQDSLSLPQLQLLETANWHQKFHRHWRPGESYALQRLQHFSATGLNGYGHGRDFPAQDHVSRLSAALHFGEVSPHQLWHAADAAHSDDDRLQFRRQLAWREFSFSLLDHVPTLGQANLQPRFNHFAWRNDPTRLSAWQRGATGYPLIDAGMRELWQTGYMHNRLRMVVGSFLVKNLLQHWQQGRQWFDDCLLDADPAINSASWQWVAGSGADAAPFFRIFNPVTQAKKFDPHGDYIRRFVPELAALPDRYLSAPWQAPSALLAQCGIELGTTYPQPIVDLAASRQRALTAYQNLKSIQND